MRRGWFKIPKPTRNIKSHFVEHLKIAYVTSFFPPDRIAGAELGTWFMARHMAKLGHEVHVVITRPAKPRSSPEAHEGFHIHWQPYNNKKGLRFLSEIKHGVQTIVQLKPDLIHANCLLPGGSIAIKSAEQLACPTIVLCYGYDVSDLRFPLTLFSKKVFTRCSRLLAATRYARDVIHEKSQRKVDELFYAGIDMNAFPLVEKKTIVDENIHLLYVGRMIPEKGFDLLIDVMQSLPDHYHLTAVGDGPLRQVYEEKCEALSLSKRIRFIPRIENTRLHELHQKCHTFVLPSTREPFGLVCLEAMSSGLPVVASRVMGIPEAISHGRNGLLLEDRNIEKWCEAIRQCSEDQNFRQNILNAAREDRQKWDWNTRMQPLEKLYMSLS